MNRALGVGLVGYVVVPCRENGRKALVHTNGIATDREATDDSKRATGRAI